MNILPPEISVIIPVYNSSQYIEKCLNSIENQTFTNFELIVINDKSTDNSDYLINKFINNCKQITCRYWTNTQNYGWCYSRNKGIQAANGKYICFLDSDDSYEKDYLKLLHEEISKTHSDFVFCGYSRCFESSQIRKEYSDSWEYPHNITIKKMKYLYFLGKTHICHCAAIYKTTFLLHNNLFYNSDCRRSGDTEFIVKVLFHAKKVSVVRKSLYNYNIHAASITTQYPSEKSFESYYTYERIRTSIKNPYWRILFIYTKQTRRICSLIEEFIAYNEKLPYLFCSKYKILFYLSINLIIKKTPSSLATLKYFFKEYIKTK